jgi:hypothetical protein
MTARGSVLVSAGNSSRGHVVGVHASTADGRTGAGRTGAPFSSHDQYSGSCMPAKSAVLPRAGATRARRALNVPDVHSSESRAHVAAGAAGSARQKKASTAATAAADAIHTEGPRRFANVLDFTRGGPADRWGL